MNPPKKSVTSGRIKKAPTMGELKSTHNGRTFAPLRGRQKSTHIYLPSAGVCGVSCVSSIVPEGSENHE